MKLTSEMVLRIDEILAAAQAQGRSTLYEHEVYRILQTIGLGVPRHRFVGDVAEVTAEVLAGVGHTVMVKIVSAGIPHKQKVGGVRRVAASDPLYVQFVLTRMREEVLSHFTPGEAPEIAGFLLVEYVPHTQAIGYEVLVGFREDEAFGPVLTVSKGGDDAEFFAAHYDPANLFLPPMEYPDALAFMNSLHIRHKFAETGHLEFLEHMAKAVAGMSLLAFRYSPIAAEPRFIFTSFEVNPFVISKDNRFVALDGLAEFRAVSAADAWVPHGNAANLEAFFRPRGVAVVGVSSDSSRYSLGRDIAALLHDLGRDDLVLINPKGGAVRFDGAVVPPLPEPGGSAGTRRLGRVRGAGAERPGLPAEPGRNQGEGRDPHSRRARLGAVPGVCAPASRGRAAGRAAHRAQLHGGLCRAGPGRRSSIAGRQHALRQREAPGGAFRRAGQCRPAHAERRSGGDGAG